MKFQKIYDNSPIFFQHFMATVYGYKVKLERYGEEYYRYRSFLRRFGRLPREEQQKYQLKELKILIEYAVNKSSFYKKFYKNINIDNIKDIKDLDKLPILTKDLLRKNIQEIITIPKNKGVEAHTGGTTGTSLITYFSHRDNQQRMATLDYFKELHGFENMMMTRATFNGKHIIPPTQKKKEFWRYNAAIKQMIYSSFHINEKNIPYYIQSLNKLKPQS
ncbi:MAG: phenylacetate--CoA ligase family protein, partial [Deltaproteobacteria bacterium]|nr:phenylacetate--CoA ligase family protein [Deltaproteobacteria bacterium]